jgi:hypothetical protein
MKKQFEAPNVRSYDGDIVIASIEPLQDEYIPTYEMLVDGSAFRNGWQKAGLIISAATEVKGMNRQNSFGHLILNRGVGLVRLPIKKDDGSIEGVDELRTAFQDEEHVIVRHHWMDRGPYAPSTYRGFSEYDALALVPGRYPRNSGKYKGIAYAPSFKKADMYNASPSWRLFRGLLFTCDR